nr:protease modulator HflC [Desulfobacterales bacterium]
MKKPIHIIALLVVIVLILVNMSAFVVDETQQAILLQLGKPVGGIIGPGLHFKIPFVQNVIRFERRLLEYDAAPAEILTKDKKNLVVDNFSRWRIADPLLFYKTVRNIQGAQTRLDDIVYAQLRVQLGVHTLTEIVSEARDQIMKIVTEKSNALAKDYGIEILDVRIKRADLPPENERAVFGRMRAERERQAKKYRSEGREEALKLRAQADMEKAFILAEAYKKAQIIKGEGDAEAARIYAEAFSQDQEFFSFIKTMEAYERAIDKGTTLVISPGSEFFTYLKNAH